MKILRPLLFFLSVASPLSVGAVDNESADSPSTILILLDGFRWDYLSLHNSSGFPGFDQFVDDGVRAKYLNPIFPANSYPNWRTIVTGLYSETHGIVNNHMYDDQRNATFTLSNLESMKDPQWWQDAEPLWITATKAGMDTALFLWSHCDVPWEGTVVPKYCTPYEEVADGIQMMVKNLERGLEMIDNENYKLVMIYVEVIDAEGHKYGPESEEVKTAITNIDAVLQELWEKMASRTMLNTTNVVIVSDHGMTNVHGNSDYEIVDIAPCLDSAHVVKVTGRGGYLNAHPAEGYADQVGESLKNCPGVSENIEVVRKENLAERYHYKNHRLIHEISIMPKEGYFIKSPETSFSVPPVEKPSAGEHGFDNTLGQKEDMRGILYATGPSFLSGHQAGPVDQVDVYSLVCRSLELTCLPNNGTKAHVDDFFILVTSSSSTNAPVTTYFIISVLVATCTSLGLWG